MPAERFDAYHKWLGIRPEEQPPNLYRLLGVGLFEDDPDTITNAADQRMAHVRSFQAGKHSDLSQKILNEIAAARIRLLNAREKAAYDNAFRKELESQPPVELNGAPAESAQPVVPAPAPLRGQMGLLMSLGAVAAALCVAVVALLVYGNSRTRAVGANEGTKTSTEATEPTAKRLRASSKSVSEPAPPRTGGEESPSEKTEPEPPPVAPKEKPEPKPGPLDPEKPPDPQPESAAQIDERLQSDLAKATTAADYQAVADTALTAADMAATQGQPEVGKHLATTALRAARKSGDADLIKRATLWLVHPPRPPSEPIKPSVSENGTDPAPEKRE